ncbi:hypothetical protein J132_09961 [Termitomyces sp. J132]|nr:hypothetical protein J132_09961 [Termitomyces sp. J132]
MNFDIDNEAISDSQPCDSFSSPTKPLLMDTVDWANSQPVALKSLLSEVKRIPEKRSINYEPTWSTFDSSFTQVPPTSRAPLEIRSRPLRRTNSSARARLGPEAASTSNPPPAPDGAFWCKDRSTILVACQNVSERMDENAFALAAQVRNTAPPHPSFKRKPRGLSYLPSTSNTKRASSTYPVIHDQESISRWKKGKQRASPLSEPIPVGATHQRLTSVPVVARPFQRVASSSTGPSTDFSSPESPDTSTMNIDIDADTQDETPPTSLSVPVLPSLLPIKRLPQLRAPIRSTSVSSDTSTSVAAPQPQIQFHPLLTQKQQKPSQTLNTATHSIIPVQNVKPPPPPPPPRSQGLLLSQSTRPPPLGMRRAHTAPVTPTNHVLPSCQRAFKPPLLSQLAQPQPQPKAEMNSKLRTRPPERVLSPEPELETNGDADSSFGDISLGVDDEELELTMRQYD